MTPNPILKVLLTLKSFNVQCLLIGGQACIVYGSAEFSRDSDFVILADPENIERLKNALNALQAKPIYFPEFKIEYLRKGHACHFRCEAQDVEGLRIDILSVMRGCDAFPELWKRRMKVFVDGTTAIDVIGLKDLVQSKKTQRERDWLMIKRLVDDDINLQKGTSPPDRVKWWLMVCRTPESLNRLVGKYPELAQGMSHERPLLKYAVAGESTKLEQALWEEERLERQKDAAYWKPLRQELENLRHSKGKEKRAPEGEVPDA